MNSFITQKITSLGFKKENESIYSLVNKDKLFTTRNYWETFFYYENNHYYLSNNGDLVENFDAPDIDLEYELEQIKNAISKFGCYLDVSRIVKDVDINNFETELENFTKAVLAVDDIYKIIVNG